MSSLPNFATAQDVINEFEDVIRWKVDDASSDKLSLTQISNLQESLLKIPSLKFASLEDMKRMCTTLKKIKNQHFDNCNQVMDDRHSRSTVARDIHKSEVGEILSEMTMSLEQSLNWWVSHQDSISKLEKQLVESLYYLKECNPSLRKMSNNKITQDDQWKMMEIVTVVRMEEKNLKEIWEAIDLLFVQMFDPLPFIEINDLLHKVNILKQQFYTTEKLASDCLEQCKKMSGCSPRKESKTDSRISLWSVLIAVVIFAIAFVIVLLLIVTLVMDDLMSSTVWIYHNQLAPS